MKKLTLTNACFKLDQQSVMTIDDLTIQQGESWAFVGTNGSGKSALACALAGELLQLDGEYHSDFKRVSRLSFEQLQKLVNQEWQRNNTDLVSADEQDTGRTTAEIIIDDHLVDAETQKRCHQLASQFGIAHLLDRRFKYLSTGETRKTLLCQALMTQPDLLILDEPFDGLDILSRQQLTDLLSTLATTGMTLVLVLNRFDELPEFVSHCGILADCTLTKIGRYQEIISDSLIAQLAYSEQLANNQLPEADTAAQYSPQIAQSARIILRNGYVHYNDQPIIQGLDWQVEQGQHWHIIGPNGAGKSTLLSLITGDHPQGYSNDLTLFGRRRGSGETIWDIKRHIGYVSSNLHLDYRVSSSVRNVILSGYYDSIGIYQAVSDRQTQLANQWLTLLGLSQRADMPFQSLSWGQQRLVLMARALVKHPLLLILDEPLQGLDALNRQLVKHWVDILIGEGNTQLLFVSHHQQDAPKCITHRLCFVPQQSGYRYQIEALA